MSAQIEKPRSSNTRTIGYLIAAAGLFTSSLASVCAARTTHSFSGVLIALAAVAIVFSIAMIVLAYRERQTPRSRSPSSESSASGTNDMG